MSLNKHRSIVRVYRKRRIRKKISGDNNRPRLSVFRSLRNIYAQVINDEMGNTLAAASTLDKTLIDKVKGMTKTEAASKVGEMIASRSKEKGIKKVVFDRGGYKFHGRIKAFAEAARKGGLEF